MKDINEENEINYLRAKTRIKEIKGFYIHLSVYITVNLILIGFNVLYQELGYLKIKMNQFFTVILWGVVILIHAISIFLPTITNWEKRKTEELMKKNQKK